MVVRLSIGLRYSTSLSLHSFYRGQRPYFEQEFRAQVGSCQLVTAREGGKAHAVRLEAAFVAAARPHPANLCYVITDPSSRGQQEYAA
jgi:hypothetical protein